MVLNGNLRNRSRWPKWRKASAPDDLKYLPMAITNLAPDYNSVGRGMWRLREAEAKSLGLAFEGDLAVVLAE